LLQWRGDHALPLQLLLALAAAFAFESCALLLRRQPVLAYLREGSAFLYAALLVAWLPGIAAPGLLGALFVALVLARQAFGGLGLNVFHPVVAGVAFAQAACLAPAPLALPNDWLVPAWLLGGLALLLVRIWRWQAPVFLLAGTLAGMLVSGFRFELLADPAWMLAAFFIAGDPVTTPEDSRARAVAAASSGFFAGLLGVAVLPIALLAMNAASPLLDAAFDRGRPQVRHA